MTNLEKYKGVFIDVFNVSEDVLNGEFTKDNVDGWDSIKQLALSSSLEEEFDLLFDADCRSTVCRTFLSAVYVFRLWNFRHGQGWSDCCGAYHAAGLCFHGTVLVAQELPDGRQASVFSGVSPLSGMEPACRNDFHMYNRSSDVRTYFFAQFVGPDI